LHLTRQADPKIRKTNDRKKRSNSFIQSTIMVQKHFSTLRVKCAGKGYLIQDV
jgi:hypothetical protein